MAVSQEIENEILIAHQKTRSPHKTATLVGVDVGQVFEVLKKLAPKTGRATPRFGGKGRPELEPFAVARRLAMDRGWDNKQPEIEQARTDYEAGTHDMATGRDGDWLILYSVPLKRRVPNREGYFTMECA